MSDIIEKSRIFYETSVKPMIERDFPEYMNRICAGIVGEGSECFGYDDEISTDHDFGIGVCLWLCQSDYDAIGDKLDKKYNRLVSDDTLMCRLDQRRGVMNTGEFYESILGVPMDPKRPGMTARQWFSIEESRLATATNGVIFEDTMGEFSRIREELSLYYPDFIWIKRLVNAMHDYAAAAQANYSRSMSRGDLVAAEFCRSRGIDAALNIAFLLEKRYAPYYKWKFRALKDLKDMTELSKLLEEASLCQLDLSPWTNRKYDAKEINTDDRLIVIFEKIAEFLVCKLKSLGLTQSDETFLEVQCKIISSKVR